MERRHGTVWTDLSTQLRERREQRASKQREREAAKAAECGVDLSHHTTDNLDRRLRRRRSMDRDMKAMATMGRKRSGDSLAEMGENPWLNPSKGSRQNNSATNNKVMQRRRKRQRTKCR